MNISLSGAAGQVLAASFKALKVLRPNRPIHPTGVALTGTIEKRPGCVGSGILWIDAPGTSAVSARLSRSLGMPSGWPDILGLALRVTTEAGPADVLLASTAMSWPGRLPFTAHRYASNSKLTSLMPYKGSGGPVLLAVRPEVAGKGLPATPQLSAGRWLPAPGLWGFITRVSKLAKHLLSMLMVESCTADPDPGLPLPLDLFPLKEGRHRCPSNPRTISGRAMCFSLRLPALFSATVTTPSHPWA